ncbi:hypothetical protein [Clostridium estertheticum]|nr:hypothetical protein [Clostridium estertheticum]MBU3186534.1 hypothetical protein [Clostridium estertheticum]
MSKSTDEDWMKRLLTCDLEVDKELYTEEELVTYEKDIENEINKEY